MSYTFNIDAGVNGLDSVTKLGAETDKVADRTKRLSDALAEYLQKNDKLIQAQTTYAGQQAKIAQLTEQFREAQQKRFEAEESGWRRVQAAQDAAIKQNQKLADDAVKNAQRVSDANAQLGASVKNFIQNPLAAAGNAAEKFALTYGAMGIAAVGAGAAFIVAGDAAFNLANRVAGIALQAELMSARTGLSVQSSQLFSRAAELAGASASDFETSMRTLSKTLSDNSEEGKKGKKAIAELGIQIYDVSTGAMRSMDEIYSSILRRLGEMPNVADRNTAAIEILGRSALTLMPFAKQFDDLTGRVSAANAVLSGAGVDAADKFRRAWQDVGLTLSGIINDLGVLAARGLVKIMPTIAGDGGRGMKAMTDWDLAQDEDLPTKAAIERNDAAVTAAQRSGEPGDKVKKDKADLETLQGQLKMGVLPEVNAPTLAKIETQKKLIAGDEAAAKATKALATEQERLTEETRRAREALAKSLQDGEPNAQRKYADAIIASTAMRDSDLAKTQGNAGLAGQARGNYDLRNQAALNTYKVDRAREVEKAEEELGSKIAEGIDRGAKAFEERFKLALKDGETFFKEGMGGILRAPTLPAPQISPERQLRDARFQNAADLRSLGARQKTSGDDDPQDTFDTRMNNMARELAAELRLADQKKTDAEKEEARLDAIDHAKELYYQAEEDRQEALTAAVAAQADAFSKGITGLYAAGRAKGGVGVQKYFRSYEQGLEETVLGNAAKMAWTDGGVGGIANKFRAQDPDSWIGKLTKGTPFGAAPAATEATKNTEATVDNTSATKALSDAMAKYLQTIPGSASYNPSAQAAAVSESPLANPGASYAPGFISSAFPAIPAISTGAGIASGSAATSGVLQQFLTAAGVPAPTAMTLSKTLASAGMDLSKLMTAFSAPGAIGGDVLSNAVPLSAYNQNPMMFSGNAGVSYGGGGSPFSVMTLAGGTDDTIYNANGPDIFSPATISQMQGQAGPNAGGSGVSSGGPTLGSTLAGAAGLGLSAFGIYSGLHAGGPQGDLTAAASAVGAVASAMQMISPALSAIPILGAVAPMIGLVASMFGTGPQVREKQIQQNLKYSQFMAPVALNESMSTSGKYLDTNAQGGVRTSDLSPNEIVQQGYYDYKHNTVAPGQVVSTFSYGAPSASAAAPTTVINNNISAMDGGDVERVLTKHIGVVGDVLNRGLQTGATGTGLQDTISRL